jgi:hypothetical protein
MSLVDPRKETNAIFTEELYFMLLVILALKTLVSISQNGFNQIILNKQIGYRLNRHIKNASSHLVNSLGCKSIAP